uniref:Uncharacterized protein n=1 Tax=Salix viminalis TaxID=40686 RepID=A0A6N2MI32_SALVM
MLTEAAYDRTIKVWDLRKGVCTSTIIFHSCCNSLCFSMDGQTICCGHADGNLRFSQNGSVVLTSGRDNLFDARSVEVCGKSRASGNRPVASNWSRSCIRPDDNYAAACSADGYLFAYLVNI